MQRVTICIYDKPDNVGGPVTWIERVLPGLRRRGINVRCLFLLHWGDTGPALEFARREGFECAVTLASDITEERVKWILECLAADPPDVFVPNLVIAGYFAARWARASGIPTVGVLHSDDDYYRAIQAEFVFGPENYRVSDLVCVSSELALRVKRRNPRDVNVAQIPYGTPIPFKRVSRSPGLLRLAFAGRLAEEQKRISEVTRAFCRVARELPGTEAVIYGDGPDRNVVETILKQEGVGLPVSYAGLVPATDIQDYLLRCDVVVLLSDYEGLPIALMEAMACGCVPICLETRSGIPELVQHGHTGLIVRNRGEDFIAAVRRLQEDPALWNTLSAAARDRIASSFSIEASNDKWAEFLGALGVRNVKSTLVVPSRIRLPAPRSALEATDNRRRGAPALLRLYRAARTAAGSIRKKMSRVKRRGVVPNSDRS